MNSYLYQCKVDYYMNLTDSNGMVFCTKFPFTNATTDYCCATGDQTCMGGCTITTSNGTTPVDCC